MAVDKKTNEALDLKSLKLPSSPLVYQIDWEEYEDSTGEPSLRLQVVLKKGTDIGQVSGEQIGKMKSAIRESLIAHGISKFPYIFITTQEELAELNSED